MTPASELTTLAVVIVSWNVRSHLERCLSSLEDALSADDITAMVWVVDNASSDGTARIVAERYPWVRLRAQSTNLGYVKANNLALAALRDKTRYVWLLNPDTIVPRGAARKLVEFMDATPAAGLVGPKLLNADGSLQECAFRFPGITQALYSLELMPDRLYYSALNGRYPREKFEQPAPFAIDHPLGAAMLARQKTIAEVGPLDEGYFMYCEEIDWAWRMRKAGWQTYLLPTAEITHLGGASSNQARPATTAYLWESRARLYRKHRGPVVRRVVRYFVRHVFRRKLAAADDPAWTEAYQRILNAWMPGNAL